MKRHPANDWEWCDDAEVDFNQWFYEDLYGLVSYRYEYFMGDVETEDLKQRKNAMINWLNVAFSYAYQKGFEAGINYDDP